MTDALNEQLSACLDGELPRAELDLLLKRVGREAGLRATIGRYALVGEAMRAERPAVASRDFASNVMAVLAQEPAVAVRPARFSAATLRYLRPAAGMAVAAGVAAVAVFSMQPAGQPELDGVATPLLATTAESTSEPTATVDSDSSYVVPTSTSNPAFIPATRLTNYVVAHSEFSSPLGRRSVLTGVLADDTQTEIDETDNRVEISIRSSDSER